MNMVSIVLPTYNRANYIRKSIQSCLNQTHKDIELIVVDDCSSDNTREIVFSFNDKRVVYIKNERNLGIAASLNRGFGHARGDFLTWTSDDNYYHEQAIHVMLENLTDCDFVYADFNIIDEKDNIVKRVKVKDPKYLDYKNIIVGCFLYKRNVYLKTGDYEKKHLLAEDYHYWVRVKKNFRMKKINKPLYFYRQHKDSLSGRYKKYKMSRAAYIATKSYVSMPGKLFQLLKTLCYKPFY